LLIADLKLLIEEARVAVDTQRWGRMAEGLMIADLRYSFAKAAEHRLLIGLPPRVGGAEWEEVGLMGHMGHMGLMGAGLSCVWGIRLAWRNAEAGVV